MKRSPPRPIRNFCSPQSRARSSRRRMRRTSPASSRIAGSSSLETAFIFCRRIIPRRSDDPSPPSSLKSKAAETGARRSAGRLRRTRFAPLLRERGWGEGFRAVRRGLPHPALSPSKGGRPHPALRATFSRREKEDRASPASNQRNAFAMPLSYGRGVGVRVFARFAAGALIQRSAFENQMRAWPGGKSLSRPNSR